MTSNDEDHTFADNRESNHDDYRETDEEYERDIGWVLPENNTREYCRDNIVDDIETHRVGKFLEISGIRNCLLRDGADKIVWEKMIISMDELMKGLPVEIFYTHCFESYHTVYTESPEHFSHKPWESEESDEHGHGTERCVALSRESIHNSSYDKRRDKDD